MNDLISKLSVLPLKSPTKPPVLTAQQADLGGSLAARRLWAVVRRALRSASMTQSDAACALQVNRSTISRAIQAPSNMTIDRAGRIARSAGYFLTFDLEPVSGGLVLRTVTDQVANGAVRIFHVAPENSWAFARVDQEKISTEFNSREERVKSHSDAFHIENTLPKNYSPKMNLRRSVPHE